MIGKRKVLSQKIEDLRSQLHWAVRSNRANIATTRVQELSMALDELIVEWVRD